MVRGERFKRSQGHSGGFRRRVLGRIFVGIQAGDLRDSDCCYIHGGACDRNGYKKNVYRDDLLSDQRAFFSIIRVFVPGEYQAAYCNAVGRFSDGVGDVSACG